MAEEDIHETVEKVSRLYSIEKWMQPRSMVQVQLAKLKEETRCPMCFGYIRSARISMVCLHRYCAKCIEQYLRAKVPGRHGDDKECPVCRAHLHSRRATKPDPVFDKIIKALYGDVDQYDAEEEALIAADNKTHVAAWQAQLADLKARQAAAVAAARASSGMLPTGSSQSERRAAGAAGDEGGGGLRAGGSYHSLAAAAAAGAAAGGGGFAARKRSFADLQEQRGDRGPGLKMARLMPGSGDGFVHGRGSMSVNGEDEGTGGSRPPSRSGRAPTAGASNSSRGALLQQGDGSAALMLKSLMRQGGGSKQMHSAGSGSGGIPAGVERVMKQEGDRGGSSSMHHQQLIAPTVAVKRSGSGSLTAATTAAGAAGKKKKTSARDVAARLLGMAARAAACGPPARCCLVHLQPAGRSLRAAAPAAAAAGGGTGRGKSSSLKANKQQQQQQQQMLVLRDEQTGQLFISPDVDQPYLTCPMELTVGCLKELLLQQLRQQGAPARLAECQSSDVQLLLGQPAGAAGAAADGAVGVLDDGLTVGQMFERWLGVGPEVQVQYRLLQ